MRIPPLPVSPVVPVVPVLLLALAGPLAAQVPTERCLDRSGLPIRTIVDNTMGWAGAATVVAGESVIYWNAKVNARADRTTQIFIYLHECGHHALGHVWKGLGARWELEAECWAIQTMLERGIIEMRHLNGLEARLGRYPGDPLHLGGHARALSLRDCIAAKTDPLRWAAALRAFIDASATGFASIQGQAVPRPSSETGIYESEADLPGTYGCEITPERDVRCLVFEGRTTKRVDERFEVLARIVRGAVPVSWKSMPPEHADTSVMREYVIGDSTRVPRLRLIATSANRIHFVVHSAVEELPMDRIALREEPSPAPPVHVGAADTEPQNVLAQGSKVRIRVPALGRDWIAVRVARTASETPCLLFELPKKDGQEFLQYVYLKQVVAIESADSSRRRVPMAEARRVDSGCRR